MYTLQTDSGRVFEFGSFEEMARKVVSLSTSGCYIYALKETVPPTLMEQVAMGYGYPRTVPATTPNCPNHDPHCQYCLKQRRHRARV